MIRWGKMTSTGFLIMNCDTYPQQHNSLALLRVIAMLVAAMSAAASGNDTKPKVALSGLLEAK
jgi:hypothetical protein